MDGECIRSGKEEQGRGENRQDLILVIWRRMVVLSTVLIVEKKKRKT